MRKPAHTRVSRRTFVRTTAAAAVACGAPWVVRAQSPLTLSFRTIRDPDGWYPSLRLKGDWLIFEISDGVLSGFGEASHSMDDEGCKRTAAGLFTEHYAGFSPSLENLARKEREIAALEPDFVTATAFSGINQALYDLLAKRERVPVWQLFRSGTAFHGLPLYTTINRALQTRTAEEYSAVVGELQALGFKTFKCAPFEAVNGPDHAVEKAAAGLATLARLRQQFPDLAVRVDFHERFQPKDFYALIPELERLKLDWLEEPFPVGPTYDELKRKTHLRLSGGELFWGRRRFEEITEHRWVDVIMPDVKHCGGLLELTRIAAVAENDAVTVAPHNPSGPVSTAASIQVCAVLKNFRLLEFQWGETAWRHDLLNPPERFENGAIRVPERPGLGVDLNERILRAYLM